jgi:hypothetical protein
LTGKIMADLLRLSPIVSPAHNLRGHGDRAELPVALRAIDRRIIAEAELPGSTKARNESSPHIED